MNLAIMQPYLFPYIGYYQLISESDLFIFYDDVNFIKGGWINRNRLIISGAVKYFTLPLSNASSFMKINEIRTNGSAKDIKKILDSIRFSYCKSPYFEEVFPIIETVLNSGESNISTIAIESIIAISKVLDLNTRFEISSQRYDNRDLSSVDRVLDICKIEGADTYVNLPGGKSLYDDNLFRENNTNLKFITPNLSTYNQTICEFQPGLSIIDVLMQNGIITTAKMVREVSK